MAHTYTKEDLTKEQYKALVEFSTEYGRYWKQHLREAWVTGADERHPQGAYLRQIRNTLGPQWLTHFKFV